MSAQEKIIATHPSLVGELNSLGAVQAQDRKKQRAELAHLGLLARMLENDLQAALSSQGSSASNEEEILSQLAYELEMLKNTFQKYESTQIDDDEIVAGQVIDYDKHAGEKNEFRKIWDKIKHSFEKSHHHNKQEPVLLSLSTYFEQLKKQEGKNQTQLLNTLISALNNLEQAKSESPGGSAFEQGMSQLAYVLQMLQVMISKYGNIQAQNNYGISQKEVEMSQQQLHDLEKKLKKIAEKKHKEKIAGIVLKVAEYTAAAISAIVAVVTFQPELLIFTAVSVAAASGATQEVTKGLTKAMELIPWMDKHKEVAEITAEVTVTLLVTTLCMLAAPAGVAEEVADASTEESATILTRLSKLNPLRLLPRAANFGLMGAATSVGSTGLINSIIEAIPMSQAKRSKTEMGAMITVAVLSLIISFGASAAAMEGLSATTTDPGSLGPKVMALSRHIFALTSFVSAGAGLASAAYKITQGLIERDLANVDAGFKLLSTAIQMSSDEASNDQRHENSQLQSIRLGRNFISKLMQGEAEFAKLFTEYSPISG